MAEPELNHEAGQHSKVKTLFVFDFDNSLINCNSGYHLISLCPELNFLENIESKLQQFGGWVKLMDYFYGLVQKQGHTEEGIIEHMKKIKLYEQALKAIHAINKCETTDSIIISDSNTVLVDTILSGCEVKESFSTIVVNPAHFDESGRLHVREYHTHGCGACKRTPNLCKSLAMMDYIHTRTREEDRGHLRVVYVGDGKNDLCPCLKLSERDVVICREGYPLAELLKHSSSCRAKVYTIDFVSSLGDFIISNLL